MSEYDVLSSIVIVCMNQRIGLSFTYLLLLTDVESRLKLPRDVSG
jgi:hypothetical protein